MDPETKKIVLAVVISLGLVIVIVLSVVLTHKCKPHCDGAYCGPDSNDSCGGTCDCNTGGQCVKNSVGKYVCQYSQCDGLHWNDTCKCDLLPCYDKTGKNCQRTTEAKCGGNDHFCMTPCTEMTCTKSVCDSQGKNCKHVPNSPCEQGNADDCVTPCQGTCTKNTCCYPQDCNHVFCGPDGCGGTCDCQSGATCSSEGVCANAGKPGAYNVISTTGIERSNQPNATTCAGWAPENTQLNMTAYPCDSYKDCPDGDYLIKQCKDEQDCICVEDSTSGKKYCNRGDVYQWWHYNPSDPSGYNCTKIRQGSDVCGSDIPGAVGFDIIGNVGPTSAGSCQTDCKIEQQCPSSGAGSCCPGNLGQIGNTAQCGDSSGAKCCLNNPDLTGSYNECIKSYPDCTKLPSAWWLGNLAEVSNGVCGAKITGPSIHINPKTLQNPAFTENCVGKNPGDGCTYNDGKSSYNGECKQCADDNLRCFPDQSCVRIVDSAQIPGMCSTKNLCFG